MSKERLQRFLIPKPISRFSCDLSARGGLSIFSVSEASDVFWERESLIFYVHQGEGTLYVNGEPYSVESGSVAFLHTFHIFSFTAKDGAPLKMSVLTLPCVEMLYDVIDHLDDSYSIWPACVVSRPENRKRIENIFCLYQKEIEKSHVNGLLLHALTSQLNSIFYEEAGIWRETHEEPAHPLNVRLLLYIWEWRTESLTAQKVAESFQISVPVLNAELRVICGCSFQQLLNRARVSYAYPALFQNDISVRSLALQAGFSNEKAFSRAFQKIFGCGPQEFRSRLLCNQDSRIVRLVGDKGPDIAGYLFKNYRMPVTIKDCARELFYTESDINQVLRFVFFSDHRLTFRVLLTELRLRFAVGLLTMSDIPIYDVSIHAGFNSIYTFVRHFKKKYGMTPSEYRQNVWKETPYEE